ncbi:hypothetical protein IGI39_004777 [Enterococcus sp. AZ135]|uniref:hypothetical protein n=1 Tax=unclassified Enterococcus TaxID=2608891 RepID=UPI003F218DD3
MKKTFGTIVIGSVAALAAKESIDYIRKLTQTKRSIDQIGKLLDPFVIAYMDKDYHARLFTKIIKERLTLEEVESLRTIFSDRHDKLSFSKGSYEYSRLLDILNKHLPVDGSIDKMNQVFDSVCASENNKVTRTPNQLSLGKLGKGVKSRCYPLAEFDDELAQGFVKLVHTNDGLAISVIDESEARESENAQNYLSNGYIKIN